MSELLFKRNEKFLIMTTTKHLIDKMVLHLVVCLLKKQKMFSDEIKQNVFLGKKKKKCFG